MLPILLLLATVNASRAQRIDTISCDTLWRGMSESDSHLSKESQTLYFPETALKTNLLYDAAIVPNIGIEVVLGKQWTIDLDWFYTWFSSYRHHRFWQAYGGYVGIRRYFTPPNSKYAPTGQSPRSFTGHHLGAYVLGMTYDVEWGGRGYQADHFGFGAGVEYGYSLPISHRLNLDISVGLGFQDGEYKEYDPEDGHYVWQSTRKRHWWGPTKAEISLVWILERQVKGGRP